MDEPLPDPCPACGTRVEAPARFCPACGGALPSRWDHVPSGPAPAPHGEGRRLRPAPRAGRVGVAELAVSLAAIAAALFFARRPAHLGVLALMWLGWNVLPLAAFAGVGAWLRITIEEIGIFTGSYWVRFRLFGIPVRINGFPLTGGYVKFKGMGDSAAPEAGSNPADAPPGSYASVHPLKRVLLNLSGPLLMLLVSVLLIGPSRAAHELHTGFGQVVGGALAPRPRAGPLVARWFEGIDSGNYRLAAGILGCKLAALNLLPLAVLNGGMALLELVQWVTRMRLSVPTQTLLQFASLAVMVLLWAAWLIATGSFLFGRDPQ